MFSCACPGAELASPHLELIWSNLLQIFKTSVVVSSPPVHQLPHVGNRLSCSMLLSMYLVLCASVLWTCHGSTLQLSSLLGHPAILFMFHQLEGFQSYSCLPSCHHCTLDPLELRSTIISTPLTWNYTFSPQSTTDSTCNVSHTPLLKHLEEFTNPFLSSLLGATTLVTSHALCLP